MSNDPAPTDPALSAPSASLLHNLRRELAARTPFAQMAPEHVERFISASQQAYFAPGETVLSPGAGPVKHLYYLRRGSVTRRRGLAEAAGGAEYEPGDLFPVSAALGQRPVTATYTAETDAFCLLLPAEEMQALATASAAFGDYLNRRVARFLELLQRAVQVAYASQTLAEQSLEAPLGTLPRRVPVTVAPHTPLQQALTSMHERRVGSMLVADAAGAALGILTRHDVLARVTLPQRPLATPISEVMTTPLLTLTTAHTALDAVLLLSRHGIRHVPVVEDGRLFSIVSERDLFALQRLSLKHVSTSIRAATDLDTLRTQAAAIRRLARNLLGQGVHARQLTELISHLNDILVEQLVGLVAARHGVDLKRACWLAFGSEGRAEQTIATDQDNGLVFDSDDAERDRPAWLAFAREVNEGLDHCGYPLCKGNVMASNRWCCLTPAEWARRFERWMEHGAPADLLNASIYFDLRGVAGRLELATPLRELIVRRAAALPRFMKQMALNALGRRPPLNWRGALEPREEAGRKVIDLKLQGTAIFVDAARLYALARGVAATSTRARLAGVARDIGIEPQEGEAWISAFEYLQSLRLRVQLAAGSSSGDPAPTLEGANLIDVASLNDIDRRMLRESMHVARSLQQRMEMDYQR